MCVRLPGSCLRAAQVSDIKRANGILSDNAMFAREHVKIPTGSIPLR